MQGIIKEYIINERKGSNSLIIWIDATEDNSQITKK